MASTEKNTKNENETNSITNNKKTDTLEQKSTRNNNTSPSLNKNQTQIQVIQSSLTETPQTKTQTRKIYNSTQVQNQYSTSHNIKNKDNNFGQYN